MSTRMEEWLQPLTASGAPAGPEELARVAPFVPLQLLASGEGIAGLRALAAGSRRITTRAVGAGLFLDVRGFSGLARALLDAHEETAAENLSSTLSSFFLGLVRALHARGGEVLYFAGDALVAFVPAGAGRPLGEAARLAAEAALEIAAVRFERGGRALVVHTGVGAGELEMYALGEAAAGTALVFGGDLVRQVCEAQAASSGSEIVCSAAAHSLLAPLYAFQPRARCYLLAPSVAPPAAAPALPPAPAPGQAMCACGSALAPERERAAAALAPLTGPVLAFVPRIVTAGGRGALHGSIRTVFVLFASFPALDATAPEAGSNAARFEPVVRRVFEAAAEFGGSVNKVFVDEKGASALLGFGLPGGFAHEDDAGRAVKAALALQTWFAATGAPFACGLAGGKTFCGPLGAPCRQEYAIIGDCVILASRLMSAARRELAAAAGGVSPRAAVGQRVFVDTSTCSAVAASRRRAWVAFEEGAAVACKGFDRPVPVFRPVALVGEGEADSDSDAAGSASRASSRRASSRPQSAAVAPRAPSPLATGSAPRSSHRSGPRRSHSQSMRKRGSRIGGALVGREAELAVALKAVDALLAGQRGSTLVIQGEAGVGKTSLVRRVARACASRGAVVLRAAGDPIEESTPMWPLRRLVTSAAARRKTAAGALEELEGRELLAPDDVAFLARVLFRSKETPAAAGGAVVGDEGLPGTGRSWGRPSVPGRSALDLMGARTLAAVGDLLARLVGRLEGRGESMSEVEDFTSRPCVVLLEDAHWCDSATFYVLHHLRQCNTRFLLILTTRPMASPPRDFLALAGGLDGSPSPTGSADSGDEGAGRSPASGGAHRRVHVETIALEGLPPAAARALLHEAAAALPPDRALDEDVVDAIVAKAAGVPLFLLELFAHFSPEGPGPRIHSLSSIPDTVEQVIHARVDLLPLPVQAVLQVAAVIGPGFTHEAVCAAETSGMDAAAVASALAALCRAGFIRDEREAALPADDGASRTESHAGVITARSSTWAAAAGPDGLVRSLAFAFSHALVQDAVYRAMARRQRREVHAAYAAFLEGRSAECGPAALALHWMQAGEAERALPWLELAAAEAASRSAVPEACRLHAEILHALAALAPPDLPPLPPAVREAAAARRWLHDSLPLERDRPATARAPRGGWRRVAVGSLRAWAALEIILGRLELARALARSALEALGEREPAVGGLVLLTYLKIMRRAKLVATAELRRAAAGERPPPALTPEEAHRLEEREARAECLLCLMQCDSKQGTGESSVAHALKLSRAAELVHDVPWPSETQARTLAFFGLALFWMHERAGGVARKAWLRAGADALHARSVAIAEQQDNETQAMIVNLEGLRSCLTARFAEAAGPFERAMQLTGFSARASDELLVVCFIRLLTGRPRECEALAEELTRFFRRTGVEAYELMAASLGAIAALLCGDDARVATLLRPFERAHAARGWVWMGQARLLLEGALLWRATGETARLAAACRAVLAEWQHEVGTMSFYSLHVVWLALELVLARAARAGPPPPTPRPRGCCAARVAAEALGAESKTAGRAAAEAAEAAAAAGELRRFLGALRTRRAALLAIVPLDDLARAEVPGLAPARRLALLRSAYEGLVTSGLKTFAPVVALRLAQAEPDPAAAAAALEAARRGAEMAHLHIPALYRPLPAPAAPGDPFPFISMLV